MQDVAAGQEFSAEAEAPRGPALALHGRALGLDFPAPSLNCPSSARREFAATAQDESCRDPRRPTSTGWTISRARISLGVLVAIEASAPSQSTVNAAVERAFAAMHEVDRRMHPRSVQSDLSRIGSSPLRVAVEIHPTTWSLLQLALRLNISTQGIFDPTLPQLPGRMSDIELRPHRSDREAAGSSVVCRKRVALDFGGFAKGYAVDRAIEVLQAHGCRSGLVNAGGDLRVFGDRSERILLRGPRGHFHSVELNGAALAVSDVDSSVRPPEHQGYYRRSVPGRIPGSLNRRYAAVVAGQAVIADALAKCVLLCTPWVVQRVLREFAACSVYER